MAATVEVLVTPLLPHLPQSIHQRILKPLDKTSLVHKHHRQVHHYGNRGTVVSESHGVADAGPEDLSLPNTIHAAFGSTAPSAAHTVLGNEVGLLLHTAVVK